MKPTQGDPGARNLEDEFFARENAQLLEQMRRTADEEARREALRKVVLIEDEAFLNRLVALGITAETALALRLIPLIFVAWADGEVDDREREAILRAARVRGVAAEGTALSLLETWLSRRPDPAFLGLWKDYIRGVWDRFTRDEQWQMRRNLLGSAREVAEAAGGFLGLTSKISAHERAVLEDLEKVLD
jgi:tellurite resistance protein